MSKTNISFNNTNYSIDESSFSTATAELKSHLSTIMNGTGATINLGGTAYNIDSAKLATETNAFVSHLGTVAGNGYKVMVGGVEYGIDSAKMAGAVAEIEAVLAGLNNPDAPSDERLEGDGQVFYTMAPSTLSFRSTAPLSELQDVQINGQIVDPANYTLEEGSTIVKLSHEYLSTLDAGSYELSVVSDSKTVKGDFTVTAPALNEYGFYYDQPYNVNIDLYCHDSCVNGAFVFLENNTIKYLDIGGYDIAYGEFTRSGKSYSLSIDVDCFNLTITGEFTADGKMFNATYFNVVNTEHIGDRGCDYAPVQCILEPSIVASDETYYYIVNYQNTEYIILPKNDIGAVYKASYGVINGKPVVAIGYGAFYEQTNLESIEINKTITLFRDNAFYGCTELNNIIFTGTIEQWNAIDKRYAGEGEPWNVSIPATYVQCSDGQVAL